MNNQDTNSTNLTSSTLAKRKRGRPRKDESVTPQSDRQKERSRRVTTAASDAMMGQMVSGVLDGSFESGYFLTVKVGNTNTVLRGLVFEPSLSVPISAENDVAPNVKMYKRHEIPIPVIQPVSRVSGSSLPMEVKNERLSKPDDRNESPPLKNSSLNIVPEAATSNRLPQTNELQINSTSVQNSNIHALQKCNMDTPQNSDIDDSRNDNIDALLNSHMDASQKDTMDALQNDTMNTLQRCNIDTLQQSSFDISQKTNLDISQTSNIDISQTSDINIPQTSDINIPQNSDINIPQNSNITPENSGSHIWKTPADQNVPTLLLNIDDCSSLYFEPPGMQTKPSNESLETYNIETIEIQPINQTVSMEAHVSFSGPAMDESMEKSENEPVDAIRHVQNSTEEVTYGDNQGPSTAFSDFGLNFSSQMEISPHQSMDPSTKF